MNYSKAQKFINALKGNLLGGFSIPSFFVVLRKKCFMGLTFYVVIAIFLPCLIEVIAFVGGQIISENFIRQQVSANVTTRQDFIVLQVSDFPKKRFFKEGSSFVELLSPAAAFAEPVTNITTSQRADHAKQKTGENAQENLPHNYLLTILGTILGCLSFAFGAWAYERICIYREKKEWARAKRIEEQMVKAIHRHLKRNEPYKSEKEVYNEISKLLGERPLP